MVAQLAFIEAEAGGELGFPERPTAGSPPELDELEQDGKTARAEPQAVLVANQRGRLHAKFKRQHWGGVSAAVRGGGFELGSEQHVASKI